VKIVFRKDFEYNRSESFFDRSTRSGFKAGGIPYLLCFGHFSPPVGVYHTFFFETNCGGMTYQLSRNGGVLPAKTVVAAQLNRDSHC
jgi:hypothetical protein